jgi:perosamine synthetase
MDKQLIRLCRPWMSGQEMAAIRDVLDSGFLTQGPKTEEFERLVANYVGTRYAFATSSCTTALHLSLAALDIGQGDDVLVPDFTFPATANVVIQQRARPILVDVNPKTYNVDIVDLRKKYTPKTKAVIPVHAFGRPASMDEINDFAHNAGITVIEDAACALGATYNGRQCGNLGDLGCFSFHPRKIITTGEGGMITTNNAELAQKIVLLRSHGGIREDNRFRFVAAGFNYRMSDINAAIGVVQMGKVDHLVHSRRHLADRYREFLGEISVLTLPSDEKQSKQTFQTFVVLLQKGIDRDQVIRKMRESGVETTIGTYALHTEQYFEKNYGYKPGDLPGSYECATQGLSLPLYPDMDEQEMAQVVSSLKKALHS